MIDDSPPLETIGELPTRKPTYGDSLQAAIERPFYQIGGAVEDLFPQISSEGSRRHIADKLEVLNQKLADPRQSTTQNVVNWVAELGSSIVSTLPLAGVGGKVAGGIATGIGEVAEGLLPEAATKLTRTPINKMAGAAGDYLPGRSVGEIGKMISEGYGAYKGFVIPEHVVENYHKENDVLNKDQMIEDWANDNYGFAVPVAAALAGSLAFKAIGVKLHDIKTQEAKAQVQDLLKQHREETQSRRSNIAERIDSVNKTIQEQTKLEQNIDKAVEEKRITPDERKWMLDYLENPQDKELSGRAFKILSNQQLPIDRATGRLWLEILDKNSVNQLKNALADRVASDLPPDSQGHVMDYIINNRYDMVATSLNANPAMKDLLTGMVAMVDKKLLSKPKTIDAAKKMLQEHVFQENPNVFDRERFPYLRLNEIDSKKLELLKKLDDLKENRTNLADPVSAYGRLLKEAKEKFPDIEHELAHLKGEMLSQENIYKHLVETGLPKKGVPYALPKLVAEKLSLKRKLDKSNVLSERFQLGKTLENIKFQSIPKEIESIVNDLESNLKPNMKRSEGYRRLKELADYRHDAKEALSYLDMLHEYKRQEALTRALESFVNMADSTAEKYADPNRVVQYLSRRLEQEVPEFKKFTAEAEAIKPREAEKVEKENASEAATEKEVDNKKVKESKAEDLVKEYDKDEQKYNQFRKNLKALEDMINCAKEKMNG